MPTVPENPLLTGLFGAPRIAAHLTAEAEIAAMIRVEAALARVQGQLGVIPSGAGPAISDALGKVRIDPADLAEAATASGVVVPGLVKALREQVGPPHGQYIHWGATSQDITDTGLILRLVPILGELQILLKAVIAKLATQAEHTTELPMAGRTRTQIAVPTTLGLRIAGWMMPLVRCLDRLDELRPRVMGVQMGGAVGNLSVLGDRGVAVMEALAAELGLPAPAKPWHTERDGIVELGNWLAMVSGLCGRMGADLLISGRSEIAELRAGEGGGSSTMPQKANPVGAEALVTLARQAAGQAAQLQAALIHTEDRDGPAWGTEWLVLPPLLVATGAALGIASDLADSLAPDAAAMRLNMDSGGGAIHAEALAFALAAQLPLAEAQGIVKDAARRSGGTLVERVRAICEAKGLVPPDPSSLSNRDTAAELVIRAVAEARSKLP